MSYRLRLVLIFSVLACGTDPVVTCKGSQSALCGTESLDTQAMNALEAGDFGGAQVILEKLVLDQKQEFFRYPRLACAYAGQAGFNLFAVVSKQLMGGEQSDETSLAAKLGTFLPKPGDDTKAGYLVRIGKMDQAKQILMEMPANQREESEDFFYGYSAKLQLSLYSSASSLMRLMRFAPEGKNPTLDQKKLQEMTPEEALDILRSLRDTSQNFGQNPVVGQKIDEILSAIDREQGLDDRERLKNFLAKQK
jgi:hypothetical protein